MNIEQQGFLFGQPKVEESLEIIRLLTDILEEQKWQSKVLEKLLTIFEKTITLSPSTEAVEGDDFEDDTF